MKISLLFFSLFFSSNLLASGIVGTWILPDSSRDQIFEQEGIMPFRTRSTFRSDGTYFVELIKSNSYTVKSGTYTETAQGLVLMGLVKNNEGSACEESSSTYPFSLTKNNLSLLVPIDMPNNNSDFVMKLSRSTEQQDAFFNKLMNEQKITETCD